MINTAMIAMLMMQDTPIATCWNSPAAITIEKVITPAISPVYVAQTGPSFIMAC
jgi:hypothetical protein